VSDAPTGQAEAAAPPPHAGVGAADVRRVWQEIQEAVKQRKKRTAALLVSATVRAVENDTLVLSIGTAPLARLLSEQSNTDVIAEALHAVLGVRWRVRCEHGEGPPARGAAQGQRQDPSRSPAETQPGGPRSGGAPEGGRAPSAEPNVSGGVRGGSAGPSRPSASGEAVGEAVSSGMAQRWTASGGASSSGAPVGQAAPPSSQVGGARPNRRPAGVGEGVPLPPEPPDDDIPPDDEEAMLAEIDAGESGVPVPPRPDPEEAAMELLTSQLGARAIDRR
jgi:DNA polymerase-3 subunit gamma/tau